MRKKNVRDKKLAPIHPGEHLADILKESGLSANALALRLRFQAPDRTLTDEDVAGLRAAIEERLGDLGGRLRA